MVFLIIVQDRKINVMSELNKTDKTRVRRVPKRGTYDRQTIYGVLDKEFVCHVGFVHKEVPVVIPTLYGRKDGNIYIHGASVSRLITDLEKEIDISVSVARVNGLVLARSAFHHSANYESVVIFGKAKLVFDDVGKLNALKIISEHIIPGRWEEVRKPNKKELKATKVLEIPINEASAKIRNGGPIDDDEDYQLNIWAGVLPYIHSIGEPIPDDRLKQDASIPTSILNKIRL